MTDWQPIETAPDNAIERLLWVPMRELAHVRGYITIGNYTEDCLWFDEADAKPINPTHWMPLPEPPK